MKFILLPFYLFVALLTISPLAAAADTLGAITYSAQVKNNKIRYVYGFSWKHATPRDAKKGARKQCFKLAQKHDIAPSGCHTNVKAFKNRCAALYYDPTFRGKPPYSIRNFIFKIASSKDALKAKKAARRSCEKNVKNKGNKCKFLVALCSDGSNYSDSNSYR